MAVEVADPFPQCVPVDLQVLQHGRHVLDGVGDDHLAPAGGILVDAFAGGISLGIAGTGLGASQKGRGVAVISASWTSLAGCPETTLVCPLSAITVQTFS